VRSPICMDTGHRLGPRHAEASGLCIGQMERNDQRMPPVRATVTFLIKQAFTDRTDLVVSKRHVAWAVPGEAVVTPAGGVEAYLLMAARSGSDRAPTP